MKILRDNQETVNMLNTTGVVGVIPTDTVYGIVARAIDKEATDRLYALKQRANKPGTIIAASVDQLIELGIPRRYLVPVADFWPNPISVVVPSVPTLQYLDQGKMSLAVRVPDSEKLISLLKATGPLLTSSANITNQLPATTITEAVAYFGDSVDFYTEAGANDNTNQQASTIIRIVDDAIEILREGSLKINEKGEIST